MDHHLCKIQWRLTCRHNISLRDHRRCSRNPLSPCCNMCWAVVSMTERNRTSDNGRKNCRSHRVLSSTATHSSYMQMGTISLVSDIEIPCCDSRSSCRWMIIFEWSNTHTHNNYSKNSIRSDFSTNDRKSSRDHYNFNGNNYNSTLVETTTTPGKTLVEMTRTTAKLLKL